MNKKIQMTLQEALDEILNHIPENISSDRLDYAIGLLQDEVAK